MARAHPCHACGTDLCRVRAARDDALGLSIVRCPSCGAASVRRPHPLARLPRRALLVGRSLVALALQLGAGAVAVLSCAGAANAYGDAWRDLAAALLFGPAASDETGMAWSSHPRSEPLAWLAEYGPRCAVITFSSAAFAGAWLSGALGHLRRPAAWAFWLTACALIIVFPSLAQDAMTRLREWSPSVSGPGFADWQATRAGLFGLAVIGAVSIAGIPLGGAVRTSGAARLSRRWRVALAQRRRRRKQ